MWYWPDNTLHAIAARKRLQVLEPQLLHAVSQVTARKRLQVFEPHAVSQVIDFIVMFAFNSLGLLVKARA